MIKGQVGGFRRKAQHNVVTSVASNRKPNRIGEPIVRQSRAGERITEVAVLFQFGFAQCGTVVAGNSAVTVPAGSQW
jgi:hypothetical protein